MAEAGATLLIVDDEPLLARGLAMGVEAAGYRAVVAHDGAGALLLAEREPIDLAVLDVGLPDISGLDVCRRLREQPRIPYVPVLMLTAAASPRERLAGFSAGADDYVPKPFHLEELLARVGAWLGARRRETALQARLEADRAARKSAEEQLAQARALVTVARTLAHRTNQSLAEVVGYAELLLDDPDGTPLVHEYGQRILGAGRDIAELMRHFAEQATIDTPQRAPADDPLPPLDNRR